MVVHSFNLSTHETEAGRALRAGDQPGLSNEFQAHEGVQGETLSKKQKEQNKQASDPPPPQKPSRIVETAKWFNL